MLDELDAMLAAQREAARSTKRRPRAASPTRIKISYWSQADQRYKTRHTTCMFRPTKEKP